MKIHSVFHIFLLKPADPDTLIQTESLKIDSENRNAEYEVEDILDQQEIQDQSRYLIK